MAQVDLHWDCDCAFADDGMHDRLAAAMGVSHDRALATIVRLFCRIRRLHPNGDISGVPAATLRKWAGAPVSVETLVEAGIVHKSGGVARVGLGWAGRGYAERDAKRESDRANLKARQAKYRATMEARNADVTRYGHVAGDAKTTPRNGGDAEADAEADADDETKKMTDGGLASAAPPPPTPKTSRKKRAGLPESGAIRELADWWNALASELSLVAVESIDAKREASARDRIAEGLWERRDELARALRGSPHHRGANPDGWVAGFDWLVGRGHWIALIERSKVVARVPAAPAAYESPAQRATRLELDRAFGPRVAAPEGPS